MAVSGEKRDREARRLTKSRRDRVIDGVCAGIADYFDIDTTVVRIGFLIGILINGIGVVAYILLMIFLPVNPDHRQSVERKEAATVDHTMMWGAILLALGILFLFSRIGNRLFHHFPFCFPVFHFWHIPWHSMWPLTLVILGIVYLVYALRRGDAAEADSDRRRGKAENKTWYRSRKNKVVAGVCGGLADILHLDPVIVRILVIVLALITDVVVWLVLYLVAVIVIPREPDGKSAGNRRRGSK